jgi:hypothetical protein
MKPNIYKRVGDTLMVLAIVWFALTLVFRYDDLGVVYRLPDAHVYQLSKTDAASGHPGELMIKCLNGADATVRPVSEDHKIIVSCGE